jgi:membrane-associated protease RseP (regulator of RpoE activity)
MIFAILISLVALGLFALILNLNIPGTWKFGLAVLEMYLVSKLFSKKYNFQTEMGMILLRSKKGLELIDKIAQKGESLFNFFADTGGSIGYGLLSLVFFKKTTNWKTLVVGIVVLAALVLFIAPNALYFLVNVVKVQTMDKTSNIGANTDGSLSLFGILSLAALVIGGLFLFIVISMLYYSFIVFNAIYSTVAHGTNAIANTNPGGSFLLPGVNLPFVEGILALAIVLIVHEGAHAVLARIGKIPVLSSGLVLFGVLPVGAFVEPDEAELNKSDDVRQTRVLIAGSTSNLYTSLIFFLLFIGFVYFLNSVNVIGTIFQAPAKFIYILLGLTFSLNFIVGTVNLLPVPLFDGHRILDVNLKNKLIVKILSYATLAAFIANFLPWLFKP